ncbi:MAG TPA: arylsulfotransferase family protein [Solirubrobacteraceae bacterium]|nr:arylsulfotransferase family protein [Solirubrobacteraceae bacterium]
MTPGVDQTRARPVRLLSGLATVGLVVLSLSPGVASAAAPTVFAYPVPDSHLAAPETQITFRGVPAAQLGAISATGSSSGTHPGTIEADSDGRGGSFIPSSPFTPGEVVTVSTGLNVSGATHGTFMFTIEQPAAAILPPGSRTVPPRVSGDVDLFQSRTDLQPAAVRVTQGRPIGNDILLTPMRGPVQWGPMIVDPAGNLVWFLPLSGSKEEAADLRVQQYEGQPVLTWWQGFQNAGLGKGEDVIYDDHYRQIAAVQAGNGLQADLHEFTITPQGTALITAYRLVRWPVGSNPTGLVFDGVVQEIDIPTGLVLFQWDSLDHVSLADSYVAAPTKPQHPYDYFHINSVQQAADGNLIVSGRNTWTVYDVDHRTGNIVWRLGGKHSDFKLGPGTDTAYQHDVQSWPSGLFTIFDNGTAHHGHAQSRGIIERVDPVKRTTTLVRALTHSPRLLSSFEGSVQPLDHGNTFIGWGALPYFTQFGAKGKQIYDGRFVDENSSYRAYRSPWNAQPDSPPALAVSASGDGSAHLYASWNGATDVTAWRVLAGPTPDALVPVGDAKRAGFETQIVVHSGEPYFAVQALGGSNVLATSGVQPVPPHVAIFGQSAFVSGGWVGSVPMWCSAPSPCRIATRITVGRSTVARAAPTTIEAGGHALVYFTLSRAGHAQLMRARNHRLRVRVTATGPSGIGGTTLVTLIPFYTRGHGPKGTVSQSPTVQIVGQTDYVFDGGTGGILVACSADLPCAVRTTLSVGKTTIARTGPEFVGAKQLGYVSFSLTPVGRAMLARAPGNQLGARITVRNRHDTASGVVALVGFH